MVVGVELTVDVVVDEAVGVAEAAVVVVVEEEAASLALFSCLILSISSSSCFGAGLDGVTTGLGAAGLGAGGGVAFLGLASSISLSYG